MKKIMYGSLLAIFVYFTAQCLPLSGGPWGLSDYFNIFFCNEESYPQYGFSSTVLINQLFFFIVLLLYVVYILQQLFLYGGCYRSLCICRYSSISRYCRALFRILLKRAAVYLAFLFLLIIVMILAANRDAGILLRTFQGPGILLLLVQYGKLLAIGCCIGYICSYALFQMRQEAVMCIGIALVFLPLAADKLMKWHLISFAGVWQQIWWILPPLLACLLIWAVLQSFYRKLEYY